MEEIGTENHYKPLFFFKAPENAYWSIEVYNWNKLLLLPF